MRREMSLFRKLSKVVLFFMYQLVWGSHTFFSNPQVLFFVWWNITNKYYGINCSSSSRIYKVIFFRPPPPLNFLKFYGRVQLKTLQSFLFQIKSQSIGHIPLPASLLASYFGIKTRTFPKNSKFFNFNNLIWWSNLYFMCTVFYTFFVASIVLKDITSYIWSKKRIST